MDVRQPILVPAGDPLLSPLYVQLSGLVNQAKNSADIAAGFRKAAAMLLLEHCLLVKESAYQLLDVEFYFYQKDFHPDPYSHAWQYPNSVHLRQSQTGLWYFHRFTTAQRYTHTRRGVDLTFGDGEKRRYGGILIRSIRNITQGDYHIGPSKVVGEIIRQLSDDYLLQQSAQATTPGYAFSAGSPLSLQAVRPPFQEALYAGTRYGLSSKNPFYQSQRYRFFTQLDKVKKQRPFQFEQLPS